MKHTAAIAIIATIQHSAFGKQTSPHRLLRDTDNKNHEDAPKMKKHVHIKNKIGTEEDVVVTMDDADAKPDTQVAETALPADFDCSTDEAWHPKSDGYCHKVVGCNSRSYSSWTDCCSEFGGEDYEVCTIKSESGDNCWNNGKTGATLPPPAWHPIYSAGWDRGYCLFIIDCNAAKYDSEVECCNGAYSGQTSGYCYSKLPNNPPTNSPTSTTWYPDPGTAYMEAGCLNAADIPPPSTNAYTFDSEFECCDEYFGTMQSSGACLEQCREDGNCSEEPPTESPTSASWYPDYETGDWIEAGCSYGSPPNEYRPTYDSELECCQSAFGYQVGGACLEQCFEDGNCSEEQRGEIPDPPTESPTPPNQTKWYPDYQTFYMMAGCLNAADIPPPDGVPLYDSELECCTTVYAGQSSSGACLEHCRENGNCPESEEQREEIM